MKTIEKLTSVILVSFGYSSKNFDLYLLLENNMNCFDVCFCHFPNTGDEIGTAQNTLISENVQLALGWSRRSASPSIDRVFESEIRRFWDANGIANKKTLSDSLRKLMFMHHPICWEHLNREQEKYLCIKFGLSEVLGNYDDLTGMVYYVNNSFDPSKAIEFCLKYIRKNSLLKKTQPWHIHNCYTNFMEILVESYHGKNNSKFVSIAAEVLRFFCKEQCITRIIFMLPVQRHLTMELLLRITQLERFNFAKIWKPNNNDSSFPLNWLFLSRNWKTFDLLLLCGARNTCSFDFYLKIQEYIRTYVEESFGEYLPEDWAKHHGILCFKLNFVVLQVIIFLIRKIEESWETTETLILLWKSLPDPFLTRKEFTDLKTENSERFNAFLERCWEWYYENLVSEGIQQNPFPSPRPLKHIARCHVRKILRTNFQIPSDESFDMSQLNIPKCLEEYVRLGVKLQLPVL